MGMRAALILSERKCGLAADSAARVLSSLRRLDLPLVLDPGLHDDAILETMARDKKFEAGQMRFVLLSGLGAAEVNSDVALAEVRDTLAALRQPWES